MYVLEVNTFESVTAGINKRGSEFHKLVLEVMAKQALVSRPQHLDTGDMNTATGVCLVGILFIVSALHNVLFRNMKKKFRAL